MLRQRVDDDDFYQFRFIKNNYPEEKLSNSHVSLISCMRCTRGRFQYGFGIRLNAYGPANGGRVFVLSTCAGPMSVFLIVVTWRPFLISLSYGDCVVVRTVKNIFVVV